MAYVWQKVWQFFLTLILHNPFATLPYLPYLIIYKYVYIVQYYAYHAYIYIYIRKMFGNFVAGMATHFSPLFINVLSHFHTFLRYGKNSEKVW